VARVKLLQANPRSTHRLKALAASLRRHGFGAALTLNATTGHVLAGNGRTRALRRMKRAGDPAPDGVTVEGKGKRTRWKVPALWGTWPEAQEAEVALALNGGVDGSLEGDLDRDLVAHLLETSTEAARDALGLSSAQAQQYTLDHAAPVLPPQINLDGLARTAAAEDTTPTNTVKLISKRTTVSTSDCKTNRHTPGEVPHVPYVP